LSRRVGGMNPALHLKRTTPPNTARARACPWAHWRKMPCSTQHPVCALPEASGTNLQGAYVLRPIVIVGVICVILLVFVLIRMIKEKPAAQSAFIERKEREAQTLETARQNIDVQYRKVLASTRHISTSLYPELGGKSRVDTISKSVRFVVSGNGDTEVTEHVRLRAGANPAHCRGFGLSADPTSPPMAHFSDIDWRVTQLHDDGSKEDLFWLPATDEPLRKEALVFFKELPSGGEICLMISWTWPGLCTELFTKRELTYEMTVNDHGADKFTDYRFEFVCGKDCPAVEMTVLGDRSATAAIVPLSSGQAGVSFHDPNFRADAQVRRLMIKAV
jgi:hypothetical protein